MHLEKFGGNFSKFLICSLRSVSYFCFVFVCVCVFILPRKYFLVSLMFIVILLWFDMGLYKTDLCIFHVIFIFKGDNLTYCFLSAENTGKQQMDFYFLFWIFSAFISSCYTYVWDVRMDWGLMDSSHGYLRAKLLFKRLVSRGMGTKFNFHIWGHWGHRYLGTWVGMAFSVEKD